jgi:hypothetical protein
MRLALAPLLAAPLLLVPAGVAHASAPTCQGQPATIQTDGGVVTGTEGPDVIVATRAGTINALGGDDLICAAGGQFDAGAGDDTVVVGQTNGTNTQTAQLGPGTDRYTARARPSTRSCPATARPPTPTPSTPAPTGIASP